MAGKTIALCVTGSIAAYKAVEIARLFVKRGIRVLPVLTESATKFVGPVTFSGITGNEVLMNMWDPSYAGEMHVHLADKVDAIVIAPATADTIAKLASGRADDLLSALALCAKGPIVIAPAMHPRMWTHAATMSNVAALTSRANVSFVGPVRGEVASGDVGLGRMSDPEEIVRRVEEAFDDSSATERDVGRDLEGRHIVVTAGPTHEAIDPVRYVGNRSSGRMGFAIAHACARRGARVTLIAGPVSLASPANVSRVDVTTALEMQRALDEAMGPALESACALVMTAAVADFRPKNEATAKIKKQDGTVPTLELTTNPDLLAGIGARRVGKGPLLVGFALETGTNEELVAYAQKKLAEKRVDLVVANHAADALGTETNRATFVEAHAVTALGQLPKQELADRIATWLRDHA